MAGRPNKSQSVGQSLIFCLRAGIRRQEYFYISMDFILVGKEQKLVGTFLEIW